MLRITPILLFLAIVSPTQGADTAAITVSGSILAGTCTITAPSSVVLSSLEVGKIPTSTPGVSDAIGSMTVNVTCPDSSVTRYLRLGTTHMTSGTTTSRYCLARIDGTSIAGMRIALYKSGVAAYFATSSASSTSNAYATAITGQTASETYSFTAYRYNGTTAVSPGDVYSCDITAYLYIP